MERRERLRGSDRHNCVLPTVMRSGTHPEILTPRINTVIGFMEQSFVWDKNKSNTWRSHIT